jgi:NAD(P)H-dependent flavin oxidoreductase YrpB (nitropropane dioxygenase family)
MLHLWRADLDSLRRDIREVQSLTSRPFAANLNLTFPQTERLDACLEEGVRVISLFWGDPTELAARAKASGAIVTWTVGSVTEARRAADAGVDIVVAQGWEAGGHVRGTVGTIALVPAVVDVVSPLPVVAAGGIADGRGMAAAIALGASGVWIGTRFLLAREVPLHPYYRQRLLSASTDDTVYLENLYDVGWPNAPHRALRNRTFDKWEAAGRPEPGSRPGEGEVVARSEAHGDIVRYRPLTPSIGEEGDIEALSLFSGQGVGLAKAVQPARDIVAEIDADAEAILSELRR